MILAYKPNEANHFGRVSESAFMDLERPRAQRHPFPGKTKRESPDWPAALVRPCPTCHEPAGSKCINMAPSHRAAGVAYETREPHRARLRD